MCHFNDRHTAIVRRILGGDFTVAGFVQLGSLRIVRCILGSYFGFGCLLGFLVLRVAVSQGGFGDVYRKGA